MGFNLGFEGLIQHLTLLTAIEPNGWNLSYGRIKTESHEYRYPISQKVRSSKSSLEKEEAKWT